MLFGSGTTLKLGITEFNVVSIESAIQNASNLKLPFIDVVYEQLNISSFITVSSSSITLSFRSSTHLYDKPNSSLPCVGLIGTFQLSTREHSYVIVIPSRNVGVL